MKLLTFNENYGDEHNVPALACFTEQEYETWLETEMINPNPKYEIQNAEYLLKMEKYNKFKDGLTERGLWNKRKDAYTDEERQWVEDNNCEYVYERPKRGESLLYAYLGNSGECFGESYTHCRYGKDFITNGYVKVFDVNQDFYQYFKLANLDSLSLCNIFDKDRI
jgi:hypothetical protein